MLTLITMEWSILNFIASNYPSLRSTSKGELLNTV